MASTHHPPPNAPHDITARINYWQPRPNGSLPTREDFIPIMRVGREIDARDMIIHDIRDADEEFSLDRNGFEVVVLPEAMAFTKVEGEIKERQYPVLEEVVKSLTGGSRVRIFNHIIRDTTHQQEQQRRQNPASNSPDDSPSRAPALRPHLDFDSESCPAFFAQTRPLLRSYINSGQRWQIIGLWRPLKTVYRDPLVLLDARSTRDEDFVRMERSVRVSDGGRGGGGRIRFGGERAEVGAGEAVQPAVSLVKYGKEQVQGREEGHRWYYIHEQQPHEMWVFKHFDSFRGGPEGERAWRCGHTSVRVPGTMGLPCRESIEFRALVFY